MTRLPKWADLVLVPLISLLFAGVISALVILAIGQSPSEALKTMVVGAVGSPYAWGYTLYYATSFMFTGLAVTVAFHASLFNIGGEGQAQLGGLGVALVLSHHKLMGRANHGRSAQTLALIEAAAQQQSVCMACYPYVASSTMLLPARAK